MTRYFKDPDSDKRSAMMGKPCMCNGEATNMECKNYWAITCKMDTVNSDHLREGERLRRCLLVVPSQNMDGIDMPTRCNQYVASDRKYDPSFDVYDPLSEDELNFLRAEWNRRKGTGEAFNANDVITNFRKEVGHVDAAKEPG